MSKEFDQGYKAGISNKLTNETPNPYKKGTNEYMRWERGFNVGCEEFNEKRDRDIAISNP